MYFVLVTRDQSVCRGLVAPAIRPPPHQPSAISKKVPRSIISSLITHLTKAVGNGIRHACRYVCRCFLNFTTMAVRRLDGFQRYAFAVQYHGASFLGFSYQGLLNEDCILKDGTDLRGYRSVEGRIREALADLVGDGNYENLQVSSRTDRGVHALRNTCHVDICPRTPINHHNGWDPCNLHRGLNYHLSRQHSYFERQQYASFSHKRRRSSSKQPPLRASNLSGTRSPVQDLSILSVARAPLTMVNTFAHEEDQPPTIDWNVRFSATQRTYAYRIFNMTQDERDYGVPFEWDRSWRICSKRPLNVAAMNEAACHFIGRHDFTSFRGSSCQRLSPMVTMNDVCVSSQPYSGEGNFLTNSDRGGLLGLGEPTQDSSTTNLVTVVIVGESFLYRQVRNMVGCLANVGLGKMSPQDVKLILQERNRAKAPAMAPAHGLFLVNVEHGDFVF